MNKFAPKKIFLTFVFLVITVCVLGGVLFVLNIYKFSPLDSRVATVNNLPGHYDNKEYGISFDFLPSNLEDIIENEGVRQNSSHIGHVSRPIQNYYVLDIYVDDREDFSSINDLYNSVKDDFDPGGVLEISENKFILPSSNMRILHLKGDLFVGNSENVFVFIERKEDFITLYFTLFDEPGLNEKIKSETGKENVYELISYVLESIEF